MIILLSLMVALLLDYVFQEPARCHPLVGFGRWASWLESRLNRHRRIAGCVAWCVAVFTVLIPVSLLSVMLQSYVVTELLFGAVMLYLALGWQSLLSHAQAIIQPLRDGDLGGARQAVGRIISRDTEAMSSTQIASAATESVLENGADAIFAALFWFAVLGVPGVVLYRLSNTLDAMWGYKSDRYRNFGWAAARVDDILNYIPARLTALSYAAAGNFQTSWQAWKQQARYWKSPNAGPVMAAGAGAINTTLGGGAVYSGQWQNRPILGPENGETPTAETIQKACALVNRALFIWFAVIALIGVALEWV